MARLPTVAGSKTNAAPAMVTHNGVALPMLIGHSLKTWPGWPGYPVGPQVGNARSIQHAVPETRGELWISIDVAWFGGPKNLKNLRFLIGNRSI